MRPRTDTNSDTQTRVTTIHFVSSVTHPKCNQFNLTWMWPRWTEMWNSTSFQYYCLDTERQVQDNGLAVQRGPLKWSVILERCLSISVENIGWRRSRWLVWLRFRVYLRAGFDLMPGMPWFDRDWKSYDRGCKFHRKMHPELSVMLCSCQLYSQMKKRSPQNKKTLKNVTKIKNLCKRWIKNVNSNFPPNR